MNIAKRAKRTGSGYSAVKTERRIPINFDLQVLDLMTSYSISENKYIRKAGLINLRNLVNLLDIELYINDPEKMKRINFMKKALEARTIRGIKNTDMIIQYASGGILEKQTYDVSQLPLLSTEELKWVDETVSDSLKYVFLYEQANNFMELLIKFQNEDYKNRSTIVSQLERAIQEIQTSFRRVKVENMEDMVFSLREDKYDNAITDIYERSINPNRKLLTGMQGFNLLTNGGYESGRVYGYFGITGVGKSMTLLNIAYQIKKYNRLYKPKDPTKTPVIVILTMENDVTETVKRLYSIATGAGPDDFKNTPLDEIKRKFAEDGELYLTDDSPIDILIKYQPSGTCDTSYMYELVEQLEDDGYETVAFIQDHLKKIRSANYRNADLRIELGEVINEMKAFAIIKDIPVITCSHLNRDACAKIDAAAQSSKGDLIRMLGKANIGESMLILDNIDFGFLIDKEYDANGQPYLCCLTVKKRDFAPIEYICQPYESATSIRLVEDFYSAVPLYKESVGPVKQLKPQEINKSAYTNVSMLYDDDEDDDIFARSKVYNESTVSAPPISEKIKIEERKNAVLEPCAVFRTNPLGIPGLVTVPSSPVIFRDNVA